MKKIVNIGLIILAAFAIVGCSSHNHWHHGYYHHTPVYEYVPVSPVYTTTTTTTTSHHSHHHYGW